MPEGSKPALRALQAPRLAENLPLRLVGLIAICVLAGATGGLTAGCSFLYQPGCLGQFRVNGVAQEDRIAVYEAAQDLNRFVMSHGGDEAVAISDEGLCPMEAAPLEGIVLGKWTGKKIQLDIPKIHKAYPGLYYNQAFKNVAMHEMLHSLGLEHVGNSHAIMSARLAYDAEFTAEDVAECEKAGVCHAAPKDAGTE